MKKKKICIPSPSSINHFVLSIYLAKKTSWVTFFNISNTKPDFGRLFSLLIEAAQMTQNKKQIHTLGVRGGIKFIRTSPCVSVANSSKDFLASLAKNHVYLFLKTKLS